MLEVGKGSAPPWFRGALTFLDRGLAAGKMKQGLNVVEVLEPANAVICYGKSGRSPTNPQDEVEDDRAVPADPASLPLVLRHTLMLRRSLARARRLVRLLDPPAPPREGSAACLAARAAPTARSRSNLGSRLNHRKADRNPDLTGARPVGPFLLDLRAGR